MSIGQRVIVFLFALAFSAFLLGFLCVPAGSGEGPDARQEVACRVLEAHTTASPAVMLVVFHHSKKEDATRLAALLREHSESSVEFQTAGSGAWQRATVFRLKSCFGRGLLVVPAGAAQLKDGDGFLLRFLSR